MEWSRESSEKKTSAEVADGSAERSVGISLRRGADNGRKTQNNLEQLAGGYTPARGNIVRRECSWEILREHGNYYSARCSGEQVERGEERGRERRKERNRERERARRKRTEVENDDEREEREREREKRRAKRARGRARRRRG